MNSFKLKILEQGALRYENQVEFLKLPALEGEVGILAGHAPAVFILGQGKITVRESATAKEQTFEITQGVFRFFNNKGLCLIF